MKHNELMIKKHKNSYSTLNYVEHLINLAAVVTGCISISTFASLVGIPIGIRQLSKEREKNMTK